MTFQKVDRTGGKYYVNVDRSALQRNRKGGTQNPVILISGPNGTDHASELILKGQVRIVQKNPGEPDYPGNAEVTIICDDIEKVR